MPNIVAFASKKGGAGKTTAAVTMAAMAAKRGLRTLVVDIDHEGHATDALNGNINLAGSAGLLLPQLGSAVFQSVISPSTEKPVPNLSVLAGNPTLHDREIERLDPEALGDRLSVLDFDLIVVDCPPSRPEITKLGVVASRTVFIPVNAHRMAMNSCERMVLDILMRRSKGRPAPDNIALIASMVDPRRRLDRELVDALKDRFPDHPVFQVSQDSALAGATTAQEAITVYAPDFATKPEFEALLKWARSK